MTRIVVVVMSEIKVSNNTENNVENLENTAQDTTYLDEADVDAVCFINTSVDFVIISR